MERKKDLHKTFPTELLIWLAAIVGILIINPMTSSSFTLCPIHLMGGEWCPGCGLGRAMKLLALGKWEASWMMHPLAGFAWGVILFRIFQLIKQLKTKRNYG